MVKEWKINPDSSETIKPEIDETSYERKNIPSNQLFNDLIISGPAPAAITRTHSFYRYQMMLRTKKMTALSRKLAELLQRIKPLKDVTITVDIDPVSLI
jgi:primosomal protein N'